MRRSGEVVGDGMTVGHPAPVGKSLIFFVGPVRTGFREFLTAKMASGFLGIDGMSMENAMSKKLNGRGGLFVLLAAALSVAWGLRADTATVDGYTYTYSVTDGKVTIGSSNAWTTAISPKPTGHVAIPSSLGGFPVVGIGAYAFYNCSNLNGVTIPEDVTTIGKYAFYNCFRLEGMTIPESVTAIGQYAFQSCGGLKSVHISSLTAWCQIKFDYNANPLRQAHELYLNGERVTKLVLPEGLKSVGTDAFAGCTGLTEVTIHDGVTAIGGSAFSGCSGLTGVTIPSHVTDIGDSAFSDCSGLTEMVIPHSVKAIGVGVFKKCNRLTKITVDPGNAHYMSQNDLLLTRDGRTLVQGVNGAVTIPSGVTVIGESAFKDYDGLTQVTIPAGVEVIGPAAFYGCGGLTDVAIPAGVEAIGANAFYGCSGLADVVIPASVTNIGERAFVACGRLKAISVEAGNEVYSSRNGMLLSKDGKTLIQGVNGEVEIPPGVVTIGEWAFVYYADLTRVVIPASVRNIGAYAFHYCESLTNVVMQGGVTNIGDGAFGECGNLMDVFIPNSVQSIGYSAFAYCGRLSNVTLPACMVEGDEGWTMWNVFQGTSVENVAMAEGITTIGSYAFAQGFDDETCLTHVTIPTSVTGICAYAFYNCRGLGSVTIPEGVVRLGTEAFNNCWNLTELAIPGSVKQIDPRAFSSCDGLTEVTIPSSVTNIGGSAFSYCRGLGSVTVPVCVLETGLANVFQGASSITNVVLSEGCREIARGTLGYSGQFPKLEHVLIPASVTNIEAEAFRAFRGKVAVTVDPANAVYSSRNGMLLTKDGTRLLQGVNGDVTIPPGVTSIDARAFYNCSGLTRVVIPDSVTNIGNYAFNACSNLGDVWMPKHLEGKLSANVFANCGSATLNYYDTLYVVTFQTEEGVVEQRQCPDGTSIGTLPPTPTLAGYAFEGWWTAADGEKATEKTVVTNDVTYYAKWRGTTAVGDYTYTYSVLNGQAEIGSSNAWTMAATAVSPEPTGVVVIPSILGKYPVTSIGEKAFSYCYDVTSFEIPEGVVDVRSHSFTLCSRLTDVIVPSSVTGIDMSAFQFCDKLVNFTVNPANVVYSSRNGLLLSKDGRTLVRGVNGEVVIPSCVTEIGDSAFKGFRGLKSVVIPDGVLSIGANAFNSCRTLMDMAIPQSVTNIGTRAFDGSCIGHFLVDAANGFYTSREGMLLTKDTETLIRGNMGNDGEVVIPDGVKIVGEGAFKSLGLECATIPNSVTNIGVSAFEGCWDLAQVIIPGSVKTIEMRAFDSCENLVSLEIARGLESIGVRAFGSCRLTRVTIPDSVTNIEWGAFSDCRELKEVWLPQHLEGRLVGVFPWCDAALVLNYYDALYTVVFRSEEGIEEGRRLCPSGESLGDLPQLPIRAGAVFAGWWTADGKRVSAKTVVTGDMTLEPRWRVVAAPVITPADGTTFRTYESCTVTITCADADAVIYYSTDGRMPHLTEACRYKGPFTIDRTTTIRAVAILDDVRSAYVAATLTQEIFMLQYRDGYHDDDAVWLTFTTGGDAPWGEEVPMGILNGDIYDFRLRSGPVGDEEESWLQTSVVGRGTFSFRWKVDCEYDDFGEAAWDHLAVFTNGVEAVRMDGTRGWERMSFTFDDDGRHTIRWVFVKDGYDEEDAAYEDCAWLGRFSWNPADVAVDTGKGRTVTVPGTWLGKRTMRAATDMAANGRKVWECYLLGLDPEEADDDFRIASFEVVDGVPAFTFSHTRDGSGVSFEPRIRILGKARLDDAAWTEMPEGGYPALRFFKAEVALP